MVGFGYYSYIYNGSDETKLFIRRIKNYLKNSSNLLVHSYNYIKNLLTIYIEIVGGFDFNIEL